MIKKIFTLCVLLTISVFAQAGPKVIIQPEKYDFGEVTEGKVLSYDFTIKNGGSDVLQIKDVRPTCGCTVAKIDKKELKKGESTKLLLLLIQTAGREISIRL